MEEDLRRRKPREFHRYKFDEDIPDKLYRERFRIPKEAVDFLDQRLSPIMGRSTKRNHPLTPRERILVFLHFLGSHTFYHCCRDIFGISKNAVHRIVYELSDAVLTLQPELIRWPDNMHKVVSDFKAIANFPCVAAVIDGTHICLAKTPKATEASYLNRKQGHSINLLVCCGPDLSVYYANANFAGWCHDSRSLRGSQLWKTFEEDHVYPFPGAVLLGDLGYPLRPWLLTPFPTSEGAKQKYNDAHAKTRCVVERAIGVMKKRFHFLSTGSRLKSNLKKNQC